VRRTKIIETKMTLFAFLRDISERKPALIRRTRLATYTAEVGLAMISGS
jgi:hypothetical protein